MNDTLIKNAEVEAKRFFEDARGSHGWDHVLRVYKLCEHIGPAEGCDMATLRLAALLHDVSREECDRLSGEMCHAEAGAKRAAEILARLGAGAELTAAVAHCVAAHRFRGGAEPESVEAKTLFDADKLDGIGAVGIGRAFQFAGEVGARLHDPDVDIHTTKAYGPDDTAYREYLVKLRHVHDRMLTVTGKRMAESRHRFMEEFFDRMNKEARGEL